MMPRGLRESLVGLARAIEVAVLTALTLASTVAMAVH